MFFLETYYIIYNWIVWELQTEPRLGIPMLIVYENI